MNSEKWLKGEGFRNRYRITGTLTTLSPLHVGTGSQELGEKAFESKVMKDFDGRPIIPGSALRGVMRHWLLSILAGVDGAWAKDRNYEDKTLVDLDQKAQLAKVKDEFSWLELLFGTPFHAGKIELWDASCITEEMAPKESLLGWDRKALTYVDTSVAIDPTTGTALEHLLYTSEVVAPGVKFSFNLVGQNLSDEELGLILLALQGFNSSIYPIQVGARTGRGYGRVQFTPGPIHRLDTGNVIGWIVATAKGFSDYDRGKTQGEPEVGYFRLPVLGEAEQTALIERVQRAVTEQIKPAVTDSVGG